MQSFFGKIVNFEGTFHLFSAGIYYIINTYDFMIYHKIGKDDSVGKTNKKTVKGRS